MSFLSRFGFNFGASASSGPTEHQGTRWRGASQTLRSLFNWRAPLGDAVADMPSSEMRTVRTRSRDAFRSDLIARAALTRCRTNIVGIGLICRPTVDAKALGLTPEEAEALNETIRPRWELWAEDPAECDWEASLDIYGQQGLALLSGMLSGDVFALTPEYMRPGGLFGLKVQLIEADRVCNPNDAEDTPGVAQGIKIGNGGRGAPEGCYIRNTHPGSNIALVDMPKWDYYPFFGGATGRRRVLQIWNDKERPSQLRGMSYLAPILEPLKQAGRYFSAELMAAVLNAMLTVFIEKDREPTEENGAPVAAFGGASGQVALGQGAIVDLAPGEKANAVNPLRPNPNFDPFFVALVKQIGAALELPLDELLLHYQSSYSAARAAMLQAWRFYTMRRWWLVQQFCQPIYGLWMDEEVASGRLSLPGYSDPVRRRAYSRAIWIGPARGAMDELKEAQAAQTRIDAGVSNETIETASMAGEDWSHINAQRAREIATRKANGTWREPQPIRQQPDPSADPSPAQSGA